MHIDKSLCFVGVGGGGGWWEFDSKTIVLVKDESFESIHHPLDVWHKSIKLTKKLNEEETISYFLLNLLITTRWFQNENIMRLNSEVQKPCF